MKNNTLLEDIASKTEELLKMAKSISGFSKLSGVQLNYVIGDKFWTLEKNIVYYEYDDKMYKENKQSFAMSKLVKFHTVTGIIVGETEMFRDYWDNEKTYSLHARYLTGTIRDLISYNNSSGPFIHEYKDTFPVIEEVIKAAIIKWKKVRKDTLKRQKDNKLIQKKKLEEQLQNLKLDE